MTMRLVARAPDSAPPVDADAAVTSLYAAHWRAMVRLAWLFVHDTAEAEEVAQDAFVAVHLRWATLREPDRALAYLRQAVVNRARSSLRHRTVVRRQHADDIASGRAYGSVTVPSAEEHALGREHRATLLAALAALPQRQREVLTLRYYLDLDEAAIADALGISRGSVKSHAHRGIAALRAATDPEEARP